MYMYYYANNFHVNAANTTSIASIASEGCIIYPAYVPLVLLERGKPPSKYQKVNSTI